MDPDPVPRYRLMRDVLRLRSSDVRLHAARGDVDGSLHVAKLRDSQWDDGTWGRFHTQDTKAKQPFATTETAVARSLALGLDAAHPILERLYPTLVGYVEGPAIWRDRPEKHGNPEAWPIWVRHFSAAMLASINPADPHLLTCFNQRLDATQKAFATGSYDRGAEVAALNDALVSPMRNPVPFHWLPSLVLLSSRVAHLPQSIEQQILDWMWHESTGVYYLSHVSPGAFPSIGKRGFLQWMRSHEILSRFAAWPAYSIPARDWLWEQRNSDGLWDVGSRASNGTQSAFPLSENWRRQRNRVIDSSVVVLDLLTRGLASPSNKSDRQ